MKLRTEGEPVVHVLSIASMTPSGQRAVTAKPGATSSMAMWCMLLTRISPSP